MCVHIPTHAHTHSHKDPEWDNISGRITILGLYQGTSLITYH